MPHSLSYINRQQAFVIISIVMTILVSGCHLNQQKKNNRIVQAIELGDTELLSLYLDRGLNVNSTIDQEGLTPIALAITADQEKVVRILIDYNADLEMISEGKTALMFASKFNRLIIARLLIEKGANINTVNNEGNTAFHYAAKYNNIEMLELLFTRGADVSIMNNESWTALDFSIINNRPVIAEYLKSIGTPVYKKNLSSTFDGPYIEFESSDRISVTYLHHDSLMNETGITITKFSYEGRDIELPGISPDSNIYYIRVNEPVPPAIYNDSLRIFAIGDIHGRYDRMVSMLKSGGVIDEGLNWIWGEGHLVFAGDILDRGAGVTEALWLIYKLEKQALEANGRVHLLLGNHEIMILNNDIRYLANKYYCLTSNAGIEYYKLFSKGTVLGNWIRKKNSIEIIGNTMFVHAGISPTLFEANLTVDQINSILRDYLDNPADTTNQSLKRLITGTMGPVWYRGYIKGSGNYEKISQGQLNDILNRYNVEQVVIGHTEVDSIGVYNDLKTIAINIPLADKNIIEQALLIEHGRFIRISSDMKKTILKDRP